MWLCVSCVRAPRAPSAFDVYLVAYNSAGTTKLLENNVCLTFGLPTTNACLNFDDLPGGTNVRIAVADALAGTGGAFTIEAFFAA